MASAVLASRNEPCWGERVRKYPNTNTIVAASASGSNYRKTNNNSLNYNNPLFKTRPNSNPNKRTSAHDPTNKEHFKQPPLPAVFGGSGHLTFNLGAYTRRELKSLKKFLLSDLERVRMLRARIENSYFQAIPVYPTTHPLSNPNGPTRAMKSQNKGAKRPNPFSNPMGKRVAKGLPTENVNGMRRCGQILTKLMNDRQGWVFNAPVDVIAQRLPDYNDVIKKPMDLGTVRSNLKNNVYKSRQDFAEDVRLTFDNALRYNPKGHYVYLMAETLLAKFEEMFEKLSRQQQQELLVKQECCFSVDGSEIELDMEELDRFVGNYSKEGTSKNKTKTEKELTAAVEEEEVDIGEEIALENYPPVVIERDVDVSLNSSGSSSSSSGSSSSSSSGSVSGSGSSSDDEI